MVTSTLDTSRHPPLPITDSMCLVTMHALSILVMLIRTHHRKQSFTIHLHTLATESTSPQTMAEPQPGSLLLLMVATTSKCNTYNTQVQTILQYQSKLTKYQ